jgi:hypothetical protein
MGSDLYSGGDWFESHCLLIVFHGLVMFLQEDVRIIPQIRHDCLLQYPLVSLLFDAA